MTASYSVTPAGREAKVIFRGPTGSNEDTRYIHTKTEMMCMGRYFAKKLVNVLKGYNKQRS